jgi:hypothetical protein
MSDERSDFEKRARQLFDESVAGLDAATRSQLNQARHIALAELERRRISPLQRWAPAGVAAGAVLAALIAMQIRTTEVAGPSATGAAEVVDALELLTAGEDLDLVAEDPEFYVWLDDASAAQGDVG